MKKYLLPIPRKALYGSLTFLLLTLLAIQLPTYVQAQTISGTVFRDYNSNGIKDSSEPLIGGITVGVYDNTNTLRGSATSAVSLTGTTNYSITPTGAAPYRVEFTIPPASASACGVSNDLDFDAMVGANSRTSIQFVSTVPAIVSFGIANAHQYASPTLVNPKVFTSCYVSGNNLGTGNVGDMDAFIGVDYNPTNNASPSTPAPAHYANTRQIGSTWGVAYSKQAKRVFTSAMLKRHTGLGPLGSGGIYMIDPSKQLPDLTGVVNFLNFDAIGIPTSGTGTYAGQSVAGSVVTFSPVVGSNTQRGLGVNTNSAERDAQALAQVGRVSFGDLDLSDDGRYLYVMNLFDRRLYEIDLTDAANPVAPTAANRTTKIRSWAIPEPCVATQGVARPWGIDYYRGKPYIGVVCDAATSQNTANLNFTVYELDPTSGVFTAKFTNALNFPRGIANGFNAQASTRKGWYAWTDDWSKMILDDESVTYPQPILSDIEFDTDGSMVLGFIDRMGVQGGWNNLGPTTGVTTLYRTIVGGDLLRAYKKTSDCQWELESAGKEGPSSPKPATGGATNGEGPGNGEFYYEEFFLSQHRETALGGLAILFGSGDVVSTIYDPFRYDSFGLGWFDNTTGKKDKGFEVFFTGNNGQPSASGTFSKGLSLGDVEIQNEIPPIQIGNRVWNDLNDNGVQDAGEPALAGIRVTLSGPGVPANTTAVTNSNGEYYFSNATGTTSSSAVFSLTGLTSGSSYSLIFPLTSTTLTLSNKANSATGSNAEAIDTDPNSTGIISFTLGQAGQNNFSYDAGYKAATCSLTATATPTTCNSATNQYTVSGTISLTNALAGTATITDGARSMTVSVAASASSVAYSLTGLTSNGASHTVVVSLVGCGTAVATYSAPASCTVAPCALAASVGTPVCNSLTNNFTATGTVSLSNSSAGSLTITDNGTTVAVISVTVGQSSASFSLSGISNTSSHTVTVSLAGCGSAVATYSAPASCTVCSLSLTTSALASGQVGTAYSQTLTTTNGTAPLAFTVSAGSLPTGLVLNTSTGVISGTPTAPAGTASFTVKVTDSKNCSAVAPLTITTSALPVCSLTATATPGVCNSATNTYTVNGTVSATNAGANSPQTLTVSVNGTSTVVTLTGNGPVSYTLAGLPSDGLTKTVSVVSSASACGMTSVTYAAPASCTVAPSALAVVVTSPICNTATNNYTTTGTVSLSNAPAGTLTLTDNGVVVGTVSVTAGQTSASFTLTGVSGSSPASHSVVATLTNGVTVTASTTYATPASCTVCSLSLTTSVLANGQIGTAYSETLTTSGATAPLSFTVSAGSLPAGLSLNPTTGVISGTPTAPAGTASFTVTVTDSKNCSAIAPLTITTAADPVCELTATATPGVCNSATNTYTVTGTISATNAGANSPQTLTISVNGTSTVVTLTGNGPVSYTLAGFTSDGLTKTVSMVSSASACGMTSVTYAAPASCSVAPALASLGDFVFEDVNLNGIQDAGDLPISGVTVTLLQSESAVATTTTSVSGLYSFTGLTPGIPYSVSFTTPSGFTTSTSANVGDDALDSDAVNGLTGPYSLTAGENNPTVDAGFVRPVVQPSFELIKLVSAAKPQLGDVVSFTILVVNTGAASATSIVVSDTYSAGLSLVPGSVTISAGSFTPGLQGGQWAIASLPANATATLIYSTSITAEGVLYNTASTLGDEASICISVPFKVCKGTDYAIELSAPTGFSRYQWFYTAPGSATSVVVADATLNTYTATQAGEYSLLTDDGLTGLCARPSCCPVYVEEVEVPLYTAQGKNPTCVGTTPQATGQIKLLNLGVDPTQYLYQVSAGSSFSASTAVPTSPRPVPADGVVGTSLAAGTYTVRVWVLVDGQPSCTRDVTVVLVANCACPEEICVPVSIRKMKSLVP